MSARENNYATVMTTQPHIGRLAGNRENPGLAVELSLSARPHTSRQNCADQNLILRRSELDPGAGEERDGVVAGLAAEVHLIGGVGLERDRAVEEGRDIADLDIGLGRRAA